MVNNSKYNKIVFFAFGIIFGFFVLFSLYFMTRYAYIIVFYTSEDGKITYDAGSMVANEAYKNNFLFNRFWTLVFVNNDGVYSAKEGWNISRTFVDRDDFVKFIVDYRNQLNSFNTGLLWFGIVGLIMFAVMLIMGNHSRNVYYMSNLIAGIVCSLAMAIFGLILIIKDLQLLSKFNEDANFWKAVSVAQNKGNDSEVMSKYWGYLKTSASKPNQDIDAYYAGDETNTTTFITTLIFLILCVGYSLFTMIHTIRKYIATKAHRNEVLERAGVIA